MQKSKQRPDKKWRLKRQELTNREADKERFGKINRQMKVIKNNANRKTTQN